ncbi:Suppressor of white apricot N-terminal domain [Trinorchestia longiramus]|nr:Suppressor of white apricot N-terminal domain [Trinorchestia longiramus]
MIDRYDVRGALYDLDAAASIGSPITLSEVQQKEEELAEYERYLALHYDLEATAEREEEETKRLCMELASAESDFNQVEYSYDASSVGAYGASHQHQPGVAPEQQPASAAAVPSTPQATQQDAFILPASLVLPPGMTVPTSLKQHKIIVKTAGFIAKQGSQMEIVLKTKQTGNALFGFLSFDNCLNRYYKHIVALVKSGRYHEDEQQEEETPDMPAASFNPSADAAPGSTTPSKATSTVSADCSYSKLISKIKENQAKQSQSQAAANVDSSSQQEKNGSAQSSPVVTNAEENSSSTPVVTAAAVVTVPKPFMGLVDYPSFNQADESDYSGSESESAAVHPTTQGSPAHNGDFKTKKTLSPKESFSSKKKNNDTARPEKKNYENAENFDDIKWPTPREQMVIDKIACYIVKNGAKFEQAIKARGDARFHFLKNGHEFNAYFELKRSLLTEVFGVCVSNSASKRAESAKDMKTVVAASKSMPSTQRAHPALPTISFKLKQRKDQECALPPTSFPLESSSSEEDLENLDADEREKREQQRQERRQWRQMKREQFEREKRERKLREEREKEEREIRMREEQANQEKTLQNTGMETDRLKALQEEENASADEEMYDIFKYAQENKTREQDKGDTCDTPEQRAGRGSDKRLKRKKAAHAFISKLRVGPEPLPEPHIIGPQLPPEIAALMMAATTSPPPPPSPVPSSPSLTPPPSCTRNSSSPLPHPSAAQSPRMSCSPSRSPSPPQPTPPLNGTSEEQLQFVERTEGSGTPPPPSASVSTLPSTAASSVKKPSGLLAATVTSLLSNGKFSPPSSPPSFHSVVGVIIDGLRATEADLDDDDDGGPCCVWEEKEATGAIVFRSSCLCFLADEAGASDLVTVSPSQASSALSKYSGSRSSRVKKRKSSKHRHDRSVSVSPDRSSSAVSSKKRKRKHHRHQRSSHKKRRHHSAHSSSKKSSSHSSSAKKKSKKKKSKSSKKGKHKKSSSRRRRSESDSPASSDDESSTYSPSSSESEASSESYASRKRRSVSNEEGDVQTEDEIQVIDSDSSSSSVQSVRSSVPRSLAPRVTTTVSSRASSASRDTLLALEGRPLDAAASAVDSPSTRSPAPVKVSLPASFDLKSSSALAKISEGLRAKVHALMEKNRPSE